MINACIPEERKKEINKLCFALAVAYIEHIIDESGQPVIFIESENCDARVALSMEIEGSAICIHRCLVDALIQELGRDAGEQVALFLLLTSLKDGKITDYGISIMEGVFLDAVVSKLEAE